jgi:hypothetical protein
MRIETKCKFCGRLITLDCEDNSAAIEAADVFMDMIACNPCGDFRVDRRKIVDNLKRICFNLRDAGRAGQTDKVKEAISVLCKRYLRLTAEFRGIDAPVYEEGMTEDLMRAPLKWPAALSLLNQMARQQRLI